MGRKHLHELLREDQEPFQLKNFIADRRSQLRTATATATATATDALQLRKRKSIVESTSSSTAARNFCINHVCLFSFQDSPDFRKSPFLDFPSKETRSPFNNKTPNNAAVFLHIPARTAAMLLDAATRVQKQSVSSKPKPGSSKHIGFGLLGSLLRRLKDRSTRTKTHEIGPVNVTPSSPPTRRSRKKMVNGTGDGADEKRLSFSCNNSRISSADWSEKSSELETSCSSRSIHDSEEIEFVNIERENDCFISCEKCFCSNPSSPFRFSLQRSPSPTRRRPDSSSPDKENYDGEHAQEIREEDDKEKEQCSPVSVLDPLFDDDEEEHDGGPREQDVYDIECSYASVERAKHQLLQKLQRFERLAGLNPIELEKHMLDRYNEDAAADDDDDDDYDDDEEDIIVDEEETTNEEFVREIFNHLGVGKIPWYMKKLVFDLIAEENKNKEPQVVVQRVCKRLHSWTVVELNTIDMMVETDFRSEGWKRCDEEKIKETGMDIEALIFAVLVEELAQELVNSSNNVIFAK
ncbi:hypothetical protein Ccrd_021854 [Cynara cardunculus var. scolymus]|uniref:DUF4378 domain-containing protein n=1 Tax=Cynara cardunculus var. scolymus TaxID=59895 RepID=A0A103XZT3_CYNCS|nr:hypothetical protein Ccrd_021854 [Cynara cardunculus var. scolymus]